MYLAKSKFVFISKIFGLFLMKNLKNYLSLVSGGSLYRRGLIDKLEININESLADESLFNTSRPISGADFFAHRPITGLEQEIIKIHSRSFLRENEARKIEKRKINRGY